MNTPFLPPNGRILAFDFGKKRIGLALSDPLGITAQGIDTFHRTTIREDMSRLTELIQQNEVTLILMGNPLHMSGQESRQSERTVEFGDRLTAYCGVPYFLWDERWTSVAASRVLAESGMTRDKRKLQIDKLSAVILLESYLDAARWAEDEAAEAAAQ